MTPSIRSRRFADVPRISVSVALTVMLVGVASGPLRAQDTTAGTPVTDNPGVDPEAKRLAESGLAHYEAGRYAEAIDDFEASYRIAPAPGLLYNLAQAQRLKGDCAAALATYRRFLAEDPSGHIRRLAEARIAETESCAARGATDRPPMTSVKTELKLIEGAAAPAALSLTKPAETMGPRRGWRLWASAGFGAAAIATGIASANFAWHAARASDDVSAIYDRGGTWGPYAMAREQSGRDDERTALWLGIGALASAAVSLWFLVHR